MSCKAEVTRGPELCWTTDSCIICRFEGKTQRPVLLTPGFEYTECMPVVFADGDNCRAVIPMETADQEIAGVVTCYQNLVETPETDECPAAILCNAMFDVAMLNWPEAITKEDLDCIITRSDKPCFARREGCVELPEYLKSEAAAK